MECTYTIEEIENFIDTELTNLNLTEKERKSYMNFIIKIDHDINKYNRYNEENCFDFVEKKLQDLNSLFIDRGYSKEESLNLAKKTVLFSNRRDLVSTLNFLRSCGIEQEAIEKYFFIFRNLNAMHAKKMYLKDINNIEKQDLRTIVYMPIKDFTKKFNIEINILTKYPVTYELRQIWKYQADLTDKELEKEFGLTRKELK